MVIQTWYSRVRTQLYLHLAGGRDSIKVRICENMEKRGRVNVKLSLTNLLIERLVPKLFRITTRFFVCFIKNACFS